MTDTLYRIVNKDGLYSSGGFSPRFTKRGKVWTNIGHVKNHLSGIANGTYKDCKVVCYVVTETVVEELQINDLIAEVKASRELKEKKRKEKWDQYFKEEDIKNLKKLVKKYPEVSSLLVG